MGILDVSMPRGPLSHHPHKRNGHCRVLMNVGCSLNLSELLCLSCRVRPLSESVNDLFREVSLLHRRITELSHRLATLEPFLRHHGYWEEGEEGEAPGGRRALAPPSLRGEVASLAGYTPRTAVRASPSRGNPLVKSRRVKVLKRGE